MQKIMHYSVVWNDLHEYFRLRVFAELMKNYHQVEEQEYQKDLQKKARHSREDFRGVLEKLIRADKFTFRSKYKEVFPRIKDEESFYGTLLEEVSSPREVYLLYKAQLAEDHRKTKEAFKKLLKGRVERFPVGIGFADFTSLLEADEFFAQMDQRRDSNSLAFYSKYLFKKMQKRQEKSVLKFMKFLYYQSGIRKEKLEEGPFLRSIESLLKEHPDKSYFESISDKEKLNWIRQFREAVSKGKNLKALIRERKDRSKEKTGDLGSAEKGKKEVMEEPILGKRSHEKVKSESKAEPSENKK